MSSANPSEGQLRQSFKEWALRTIRGGQQGASRHPLHFLVDGETGTWHTNRIGFPDKPSVDAGHRISKFTGATHVFALEDSDFNRNKVFNRHENTRSWNYFDKAVVLIGGVPVEARTALMYERLGLLPRGAASEGRPVLGAGYDATTGTFRVLESSTLAPRSPSLPSVIAGARGTPSRKVRRAMSNQNAVAMLAAGLASAGIWLARKGIDRQVDERLKTEHASTIARAHANGQGILVIVRVEQYAGPDEFHVPVPNLLGVYVVAALNPEEAMEAWHRPGIMTGPSSRFHRVDESYAWLPPGTAVAQ